MLEPISKYIFEHLGDFIKEGEKQVACILNKELCGLKQVTRAWYVKNKNKSLKSKGLSKISSDPNLYVNKDEMVKISSDPNLYLNKDDMAKTSNDPNLYLNKDEMVSIDSLYFDDLIIITNSKFVY